MSDAQTMNAILVDLMVHLGEVDALPGDKLVAFIMDRYDELRRQKSEEWTAMANEPATDEEIASYKRHEGCSGSCTPCLEKFRLIARIEKTEAELAEFVGSTRRVLAELRTLRGSGE